MVAWHEGAGGDTTVLFDIMAETMDRTNLGRLQVGDRVDVERSLKVPWAAPAFVPALPAPSSLRGVL